MTRIRFEDLARDKGYFHPEDNPDGVSFRDFTELVQDQTLDNFSPEKYTFQDKPISRGIMLKLKTRSAILLGLTVEKSEDLILPKDSEAGLICFCRVGGILDDNSKQLITMCALSPRSEENMIPVFPNSQKEIEMVILPVIFVEGHITYPQYGSLNFWKLNKETIELEGINSNYSPEWGNLTGRIRSDKKVLKAISLT